MDSKIIFQGKTEKGLEILVRYPTINDLNIMHEYVNGLSKERTFFMLQGEEVTLEEEKKYLQKILDEIKNNKRILFLIFCDGKLIGHSDFRYLSRVRRHIGTFGIIVHKDFRYRGTGKLVMKLTIDEAKKIIPDLKIVILDVFETNDIARKMYDMFGFKEYGRLPKGIMRENGFEDDVLMYKNV